MLEQFVGFVIGQITIIAIFLLMFKSNYLNQSRNQKTLFSNQNSVLFISLALALLNGVIKIQLLSDGYGSTYSNSEFNKLKLRADQDSILINTAELTDQIVWLTSFFGLFISNMGKRRGKLILYGGILLATFFVSVYLSRSRLLFLVLLLTGVFVYQSINMARGILYVKLVLLIAPFTVLASPLANHFLARENVVFDNYLDTVANGSYRADLTDFAYSICKKTDFIKLDFKIIANGFFNSVPSVLMPSKRNVINDGYTINLNDLGLVSRDENGQELMDYQDSYFSSGAMCFGSVGIFILPLIIIMVISRINNFLGKASFLGASQLVAMPFTLMFIRLEVEYSNIIIHLRNAVQATIILAVLWWLASRFRLANAGIKKFILKGSTKYKNVRANT
jgi:hypothetical protein